MRKLYRVKVTFDIYVAAENGTEAELIASRDVHEETICSAEAKEVLSMEDIDSNWIGALPYSNKPYGALVCEEYLEDD